MRIFALALFMLLTLAGSAFAQENGPYVRHTLVPEKNTIAPGEDLLIGIALEMAPHWHVYWLNPGDSGLPVRTSWVLPDGFEIEEIKWPIPDKIYEGPLANYGYYDQAVLFQTLRAPDVLPEGPLALSARVDVLVCNEICIPESAALSLRLNDPAALAQDNGAMLKQAQDKLPGTIAGAATFTRADTAEEKRFALKLAAKNPGFLKEIDPQTVEFFPEEWGVIDYPAKPAVHIEGGILNLTHITPGDRDWNALPTLKGLLAYTDKDGSRHGFAITAKQVSATRAPLPAPEAGSGLIRALILAILGGLILNLMPCVFPVLSMKALSLVKMSEKHPEVARLHGLSYTAGVVSSFLAVGISLLALKAAGSAIGWGFQLQNPVVVGLLAYLLFAIGLNLMGFFAFGGGFGNIGNSLAQKDSPAGSFFTGVLATIVATPCTAPFMGAAIGYAVVQPAPVAMGVFIALGFGLALPYLLLSFAPALRKGLPKPGLWMESFRQFLAFPMFASAIWLVWVISQQSGPEGVLVTLLGMLSFAFAIWLFRRGGGAVRRTRLLHLLAIFFILIPVVFLAYMRTKAEDVACAVKTYDFGAHFSPQRLENELQGIRPVFVEMTAAWCITCKANHASSIDVSSTRTLFDVNGVVYLIGDWTNYNADITKYLEAHGRNGVPLYVFYGAPDKTTGKRPAPKVLPQVLTPTIVQDAIEGKM